MFYLKSIAQKEVKPPASFKERRAATEELGEVAVEHAADGGGAACCAKAQAVPGDTRQVGSGRVALPRFYLGPGG